MDGQGTAVIGALLSLKMLLITMWMMMMMSRTKMIIPSPTGIRVYWSNMMVRVVMISIVTWNSSNGGANKYGPR